MPRTITDVDVLQEYVAGVVERADHHAGNVDQIALAVAGAIIWRKDGDIRVYERQGQMTNALWATIGGRQYAFSYNHDAGMIEVRGDSIHGPVLTSFSNATSIADVKTFFAGL